MTTEFNLGSYFPILFFCALVCVLDGTAQEPLKLYANASWYVEAPSVAKTFEGTLLRNTEPLGPDTRQNPWILKTEAGRYTIYDPERRIYENYLNTTVRIQGKLINDTLAEIINEIWPAKIE